MDANDQHMMEQILFQLQKLNNNLEKMIENHIIARNKFSRMNSEFKKTLDEIKGPSFGSEGDPKQSDK